jgi:hypothetical protein
MPDCGVGWRLAYYGGNSWKRFRSVAIQMFEHFPVSCLLITNIHVQVHQRLKRPIVITHVTNERVVRDTSRSQSDLKGVVPWDKVQQIRPSLQRYGTASEMVTASMTNRLGTLAVKRRRVKNRNLFIARLFESSLFQGKIRSNRIAHTVRIAKF